MEFNTSPPKVTVVISVYNGLPHLKEAIESILNQTFEEFELLIIVDGDEGNKDGSFEFAQSYAAHDSRIRVLKNEVNLGTSGTMNKGIELASAPIVARMDHDDVSLPDRLKSQFAFLEAHPTLAIICSWEYGIDAMSRIVRRWSGVVENYGGFLGPLILGNCPIWHPSIMFQKDAIMKVGGYKKEYQPAEDFELTMRLAIAGYHTAIVPEYLVSWRNHGQRQSVKKFESQENMRTRVHMEMIQKFFSGFQEDVDNLAKFLRMDPVFWNASWEKNSFYKVLTSLTQLFEKMRLMLHLTDQEFRTMTHIVYARFGRGVKYARYLQHIPSFMFPFVFFGLSPLLLPSIRSYAALIHEFYHELRYPRRLLRAGIQRRDSA